jgi:tetratricopeptide (TPR) repeat protein
MDRSATTYTLDSLADVLNVPADRLRAWVRAGLIRPINSKGDIAQFDFRQVSAAKSLCDLLATGVTLGRVRKSLDQLRQWKPGDAQSLEQLAILQRSGVLLVRLDQCDLAETNGQYHFDFDEGPDPTSSMRIVPGPRSAPDWFAQGLKQEEAGLLPEAAGSYRQALLDGGPNIDTGFALANVLRCMGERQQAVERYLQVVEMDSSHSDCWNNLGLCLEELGSIREAAGAFRRALQAAPDNWRARYNLADALDDLGEEEEARLHWREYLRFDRESEHALHAMERLKMG